MGYRSGKTIKREFLESRSGQTEAEFVAACALPSECAGSALRVRSAIANLAGVDAANILASDRFNSELAHFDFWGSLDSIAVVLELEKCLGIEIADETASDIPDPEGIPGLTVAEWVRSVLRALQW